MILLLIQDMHFIHIFVHYTVVNCTAYSCISLIIIQEQAETVYMHMQNAQYSLIDKNGFYDTLVDQSGQRKQAFSVCEVQDGWSQIGKLSGRQRW